MAKKATISTKLADPKSVARESEYVRRPAVARPINRAITKANRLMTKGGR